MFFVASSLTFESVITVLQIRMIKKKNHILSFLTLLLLCFGQPVQAQLYPGDANNDGRVNNLDILYIGYAYGNFGPSRVTPDVEFAEVTIPLLWEQRFPNPDSTNFAFADTNGDGIINFEDFVVVSQNYGAARLNPTPPVFTDGIANIDPQMRFGEITDGILPTAGSIVEIPVFLEHPMLDTLENINGLAFTVEFDSEYIQDIRVDFAESWLVPDSAAFQFQRRSPSNQNRLEAAITRFGRDPVSGTGKVLKLRAVIEDDLIGLRPRDTVHVNVKIKFIKLLDGDFREIPVINGETKIVIYHPDMLVPIDAEPIDIPIQVFPNPARDWLHIISPERMYEFELYNAMGTLMRYVKTSVTSELKVNISEYKSGIYFVKIHTKSGFITKRIVIE